MKTGYIYKITNLINNKIYIGKTTTSIKQRFSEHLANAKRKNRRYTSYLYNAVKKYGEENFSIEILEIVNYDDESELDERERYYIKELETQNQSIGYNIQEGGEGGSRRSKEYKPTQKQLDALLRCSHLPMSEKAKKMLSQRRTKCVVSEETREKLRQTQLGRKRIYKGDISKYVYPEELETYLGDGWELGAAKRKK